ncbi:AAA family ATPase [Pseudomonas sp. AO-1]|uniref:AAA family ATPase n=1 Tax=Pseudomonas sp. AO-1 TaxID=2855434 RepID=UPI001C797926|nr:ATP-binding protein [Pseudomonas sp. AO-1]QXZ15184.1 AAA family ATPase [Pseudomonas sp. AO-1]
MIKSIWVDNFKSLVKFDLQLASFTCLVGLNGAGKSTVLQAIDFIARLMLGDLDGWLKQRQWDKADINSKLTKRSNIEFRITFEDANFGTLVWSGSINRTTLNCTQEHVTADEATLLKVEEGSYSIVNPAAPQKSLERSKIVFEYQGSILSALKDSQLSPELLALKSAVSQIHSLDLLSPELLRSKTRDAEGHLGLGGERLSAYIHEARPEQKERLRQQLSTVYQQLEKIETRALRSGWKQLDIVERFGDQELKTSARHMNDGMLRLMAILSQLASQHHFLLFDEIENGINPELVEYLVDRLVSSNHQVMVTTHSPMIINYMDDRVAAESVVYLYKTREGFTRSIKLFDIPSLKEKLQFMGPGEAFIDTDLTHLYQEIESVQHVNKGGMDASSIER